MRAFIAQLREKLQEDKGIATLYFVIMVPVFLGLVALIIVAAGKVQANQQAYSTAAGAARAAANAVSGQAIINGTAVIDAGAAASAANSYLSAAGVGGSVAVDGDRITVTVASTYDFVLLPGSAAIDAVATAELITQ
ncbi:hypothetical protein ACPW96_18280 [Micromonospora sp. DT81.3]|uniref:hypothetical protein n=1 Tax=Micromonospora sp. DT81.3 TaxID=3416523 RepID=UPI003CEC1091